MASMTSGILKLVSRLAYLTRTETAAPRGRCSLSSIPIHLPRRPNEPGHAFSFRFQCSRRHHPEATTCLHSGSKVELRPGRLGR